MASGEGKSGKFTRAGGSAPGARSQGTGVRGRMAVNIGPDGQPLDAPKGSKAEKSAEETNLMVPWASETIGTGAIKCVWLHGWGQSRGSLFKLAMQLGDRGKHRLFDQPGFGDTRMLPAGSGTVQYAADLLPQLSAEPTVLVGHSFGARVAIRLAHSNPERVRGLVLIAGAGLQRQKTGLQKLRGKYIKTLGRLAKFSDRTFGTDYAAQHRQRFGSPDYLNAGKLRETFVKVVSEDLAGLAKFVKVPVLLIYGSEDTETPPEFGRRYRRLFSDADLKILRGYGHLDILERGSYQVEAHVRPFFNRLEDIAKAEEERAKKREEDQKKRRR